MKFQLTVLACALALVGCADHAARERLGIEDASVLKTGIGALQNEAAGAVNPQWINTYASIQGSRATLNSLQAQLDQTPGEQADYFHAKAQCWINAASQARDAHDDWGFVEEAIGQAAYITMNLARGTSLSAVNPALRTVSMVRPDLWQIINTIKADSAVLRCPPAQAPLACAEVGLMQAGHDAWIRSFSSAEKRLPEVRESLRKSAQAALQCKEAQQSASSEATPAPQAITLGGDSLFRFDGADTVAILPGGKQRLDALAVDLKKQPATRTLKITGYTDRLGDDAYNLRLSSSRARTVEQYLRTRGVTLPIIAQGRGSANQRVDCRQAKRDALIRCLAPNRRVVIELADEASLDRSADN
ncbi:OmpA family protein [Paraburkholderia sediminicola]|uniref:OmpA family protein n=1 Tax=Paraburkholderia rhynchosiae TaxID=487049 RepID=A0ACC7NAV1_9BURK